MATVDAATKRACAFLRGHYAKLGDLAPPKFSQEEQRGIGIIAAFIRAQPPRLNGFRCHNCKAIQWTANDHAPERCPECRCRDFSAVAPSSADPMADAIDAARWRALWSSDRIRMMGCAGFDFADDGTVTPRDDGGQHMGVEVWDKHPAQGDGEDSRGRKVLLAYVDARAAAVPARQPVPTGFDEEHGGIYGENYGDRSVKRSHRAEGRNYVD